MNFLARDSTLISAFATRLEWIVASVLVTWFREIRMTQHDNLTQSEIQRDLNPFLYDTSKPITTRISATKRDAQNPHKKWPQWPNTSFRDLLLQPVPNLLTVFSSVTVILCNSTAKSAAKSYSVFPSISSSYQVLKAFQVSWPSVTYRDSEEDSVRQRWRAVEWAQSAWPAVTSSLPAPELSRNRPVHGCVWRRKRRRRMNG